MRVIGVISPIRQIVTLGCSNSRERGCSGKREVYIPSGSRKPVRRSANIDEFAF